MSMAGRLMRNRRDFDQQGLGKWWRSYFSAATFQLDRAVRRWLTQLTSGRFLDVGCGAMPYRALIEKLGADYYSLDIEERVPGIDILADVQAMPQVNSSSYDTVLCTEVLEHVREPGSAVTELSRILRPGGHLVVTMPHLSRIHEAPNDYQRLTKYGLQVLLGASRLEVIEIAEVGSVFSFLAHQASSALILPVWHIPVLKWIAFGLTLPLITLPALALDRIPGVRIALPLGHIAAATRHQPD